MAIPEKDGLCENRNEASLNSILPFSVDNWEEFRFKA